MASSAASFAQCWDRHLRERGERAALADRHRTLNWRQASELSRRLAGGLKALDIERGSIVACWLPNLVESYVLRIACERAGLVWLPIAARLREWELHNILERSQPSVLVLPRRFRDRDYLAEASHLLANARARPRLLVAGTPAGNAAMSLDAVAALGSDNAAAADAPVEDLSMILPTSGSTGIPKFAEYRLSAWLLRGEAQADVMGLRDSDVIVALSQGIGPSIIPLFAAPIAGAAVYLVDEFDPDAVIEALARVRPTIICGVPPQIIALLEHPRWSPAVVDRLRVWYTTGAAFPPAAAARVERSTPGIVLCGYGGMDFGGWTVPSPADPPPVRHHTVGRPRADTELRLVDDSGNDVSPGEAGEVWGRGPCCATGYFRDDAATREARTPDGWFRTGDLGRFDAAGNLIIVGRKKDSIRRGGMSIEPGEIEALLAAHPRIRKVAVVGFPDPLLGERACAFVVANPGETVTLEEVTAFLRAQRIASFKLPERLQVVPDLPVQGDKIDRAALRRSLVEHPSTAAPARADLNR